MSRPYRLPYRLALAGTMGSGKTSVAKALAAHGFVRLAFADQLRAMLEGPYGAIDKLAIYRLSSGPKTGRELLQEMGSVLRGMDEQIFVKALARELEKLQTLGCRVVVDDVRMPHEAEFLRLQGFYLVRLDADPAVRRMRSGSDGTDMSHPTEAIDFDAPLIDTTALPVEGVLRLIEERYKEREA